MVEWNRFFWSPPLLGIGMGVLLSMGCRSSRQTLEGSAQEVLRHEERIQEDDETLHLEWWQSDPIAPPSAPLPSSDTLLYKIEKSRRGGLRLRRKSQRQTQLEEEQKRSKEIKVEEQEKKSPPFLPSISWSLILVVAMAFALGRKSGK